MVNAFSEFPIPLNVNLRIGKQYGALYSIDTQHHLFASKSISLSSSLSSLSEATTSTTQTTQSSLEIEEASETLLQTFSSNNTNFKNNTTSQEESQLRTFTSDSEESRHRNECSSLSNATNSNCTTKPVNHQFDVGEFCSPDETTVLQLLDNFSDLKKEVE
jgi:hypothetical protein